MADHVDAVFASEPVPGGPGTAVGPKPADLFADHVDTPRPAAWMLMFERCCFVQKRSERVDSLRQQDASWTAVTVKNQFVVPRPSPAIEEVERQVMRIGEVPLGQPQCEWPYLLIYDG